MKQTLNRVYNAYTVRLETNPLRTKMLTSAFLFSVGDFLCQRAEASCKKCPTQVVEEKTTVALKNNSADFKFSWDKHRTMRQGLIGGMMLSPGLHFFLTRVMARLAFPASYSNFSKIGMRVAVHQACMMPFIQFSLLFVSGML